MLDIQTPRMTYEPVSDTLGRFEVEPLDRGFGHTFGNSLRRVLLSSLEGAAVTSVRIEGVQHEFTTIPGLREDVTDVILNLRELVARLHGEVGEIEVELSKVGPGPVTAGDISAPADLEILNPDLEIGNLEAGARLDMILMISRGRGYVAAEHNKGPGTTIGVIPVNSNFSPVLRVRYEISAARVGQRTDYDKLLLEIETDGSIDPRGAMSEAARDAHRPPGDLRGPRQHQARRRDGRRGAALRRRYARHHDRGARAGRPLVQLPQACGRRDHRRPHLEDGGRAVGHSELRQEEH